MWLRTLFIFINPKINSGSFWRFLLSWKVFFTTKVCLCPHKERFSWKFERISSLQSVLPRFAHCFYGPRNKNSIVLRWWHRKYCEKNESWPRKWKKDQLSRKFLSSSHNQLHPNLCQTNQNFFRLEQSRVDSPLVVTVTQNFLSILNLYTFGVHWSNITFSVSSDGIDWYLDCG